MADNFTLTLETLRSFPARKVINPLISFFCSTDPNIRWRAIMAMGSVVAKLADEDMESARVVMRRMIWNLNDESGGIGWGAPEVMGEIMAQHEGLAQEYAPILVSYIREDGNFLEHEPLQRGALWGLARLAQTRSDLILDAGDHLLKYLSSGDPMIRGLAAWNIGLLGGVQVEHDLEVLKGDEAEFTLYLDGVARVCRVSEMATLESRTVTMLGLRH